MRDLAAGLGVMLVRKGGADGEARGASPSSSGFLQLVGVLGGPKDSGDSHTHPSIAHAQLIGAGHGRGLARLIVATYETAARPRWWSWLYAVVVGGKSTTGASASATAGTAQSYQIKGNGGRRGQELLLVGAEDKRLVGRDSGGCSHDED